MYSLDLLNHFVTLGESAEQKKSVTKKIRIINRISVTIILVTIPCLFFNVFFDQYLIFNLGLLTMGIFSIPLFLNYRQQFQLSKVFFTGGVLSIIGLSSLLMGEVHYVHYTYLLVPIIGPIIFKSKRSNQIVFTLSISLYFITLLLFDYVTPVVPQDGGYYGKALVGAVVGIISFYVSSINNNESLRHESIIEEQNESLQKALKAKDLKQNEMQLIADSIPASIAYLDKTLNFTFCNKQFEKWYGISSGGIGDFSARNLTTDDDYAFFKSYLIKAFSGEAVEFTKKATYTSKYRTHLKVSFIPDLKGSTHAEGVFIFIEDISDLKKTELELRSTNEELKDFVAIASHDMKEPLRMITSFSQLFINRYGDTLDSNGKEFIDYITTASNRMSYLLEDLLSYARAGVETKPPSVIDLNHILEIVGHNLHLTLNETNGEIDFIDLPTVEAHSSSLIQLFQNLISNSLKFRKPNVNPVIKVTTVEQEKTYLIKVEDNGIGIDKGNHKQVFEVFKKLHSKAKYDGSGIGLATCQKIVEKYGGKIWLESSEGIGTTFFFTLPKVEN